MKEKASAQISVLSESSDQIVLSLADTLDDSVFDEPLTIRSEIPANWTSVTIQQGTYSTTLTPSVEGSATVVYYSAIPDDGNITLSSGSVTTPPPTIGSLSPSSATAGGSAFTLTVNGTNFISGSAVRWNGTNRTTTYVSATQVTAAITAADIATAGTATVTVFNPDTGRGHLQGATFTINGQQPRAHHRLLESYLCHSRWLSLYPDGQWYELHLGLGRALERHKPDHHVCLSDAGDRCHHGC